MLLTACIGIGIKVVYGMSGLNTIIREFNMKNLLAFMAVIFLLPGYAGLCEKVSEKIINVKIAKHSDLKATREANKFLTETVKSISKMKRPPKGGVNDEELSALYEVAKKYPSSKAALRAKYMIGAAYLYDGAGGQAKNAKITFNDIVTNYPNTFEAKMSQAALCYFEVRESRNQKEKDVNLRKLINALRDVLPYARDLDAGEDELSEAFRKRMLRSSKSKFVPLLKLDIAALIKEQGKIEEAKRLYKEIMEEYPNSLWSVKALNRLRTMELYEKEKGD
jgi:tetratricopeptide (TPR) repeat protein